jgi:hypothetical protein
MFGWAELDGSILCPMGMRSPSVVLSLAMLLGLAGCAASGSSPGSASNGTLTGTARLYGGPLNSQTGKMAMNGNPSPNTDVRVLQGSAVAASSKTNESGVFTFHLAPGHYSLDCSGGIPVTIVSGVTVEADCPMPIP